MHLSSSRSVARGSWALLAFGFCTPSAWAWESECRVGDVRDREIRESICHPERFEPCPEGVAAPRGTQWGEHALIAQLALIRAGLSEHAQASDVLPPYYVHGGKLAASGAPEQPTTLVPAPPGASLRRVVRPLSVVEMAQVPDVSYSLADFLAGNEHCFVDHARRASFDDIQACHVYFTHLGPVNSTHFLPQAQSVYRLYHDIALARARACRRLTEALPRVREVGLSPDIVAYLEGAIASCGKEALAFEAVGAHYLGDAWSSGHMFQRWGSPVYPETRVGQVGAMVVGALSGLQHGWRAVAATTLGLGGAAIHDRMCLPGPFQGDAGERWVRFKPHGAEQLIVGGGDDYLLGCTSMDPTWSLLDSDMLAEQRERMLACMSKGFFDVRAAMSAAPPTPPAGVPADLDPTGPACWGQRVSNRTFYEGTGVTAWSGSSDPAVLARMIVKAHTPRYLGPVLARWVEQVAGSLLFEARMNLAAMQARVMWRAWRDPDGTDLSDLPGFTLGQLLFTKRNGEYAALIDRGEVSYYEERDPERWSAHPLTSPASCASDAECPARAFCGPAAGMDRRRRCYPQEAVFLSAFRAAHLEYWCGRGDYPMIAAEAMRCRESEDRDSEACDACVESVLPRLAQAPPPEGEHGGERGDADREEGAPRSLCEVAFGFVGARVTRELDPARPGDARRAARDFCAGQEEVPADPSGAWSSPQGCLQVVRSEELVMGTIFYPNGKRGSLVGHLEGRRWKFDWHADLINRGTGELTVSDDGARLSGFYVDSRDVRGSWELARREGSCAPDTPQRHAIVLLEMSVTGRWHWKNYRCTRVTREVVRGTPEMVEQGIQRHWERFVEGNERCRQKGCNRASGIYARYFFPETWSQKRVVLQSAPSMWRPKDTSRCEGTMDGGFAGSP